jgi:hypothetical protein
MNLNLSFLNFFFSQNFCINNRSILYNKKRTKPRKIKIKTYDMYSIAEPRHFDAALAPAPVRQSYAVPVPTSFS